MRFLFFKQRYVGPILRGEKRSTLRAERRGLAVGDVVRACVGVSRPFADLEITSVALREVADFSEARRAELLALYPGIERAWQVGFRLLRTIREEAPS